MESFGLSYNKVDYIGWLYLTTCLDKQDKIKKRRYIWNYSSLKQQAHRNKLVGQGHEAEAVETFSLGVYTGFCDEMRRML